MSLKLRIRAELDKTPSGDGFDSVLETIIREGVSEDELREILPEIIKQVARTRVAAPFMSDRPVVKVPAPVPTPAVTRPAAPYRSSERPAQFQTAGGVDTLTRPAPVLVNTTPTLSKAPELLPKAQPVFRQSGKVAAYQSSRLEELYPVGSGQYKKLKEMNTEDIRFNVRMLEGRVKGLNGKIRGWNRVLDQMQSYKVSVVGDLPDNVKEKL